MATQEELLSVKEIASVLKVSLNTVYRILDSGELPYYQIKGTKRVKRDDFDAYLEQQRKAILQK